MVGNDVLLNLWRTRFYNALQEKDWDSFVREMLVFCVLATVLVVLAGLSALSEPMAADPLAELDDQKYLGEWLHDANHYRMQLQGDAADNPDQRMTDDVKLFVEPDARDRGRACSAPSSRWRPLSSSSGDCPAAAPLHCSAAISRSPAIWCGPR